MSRSGLRRFMVVPVAGLIAVGAAGPHPTVDMSKPGRHGLAGRQPAAHQRPSVGRRPARPALGGARQADPAATWSIVPSPDEGGPQRGCPSASALSGTEFPVSSGSTPYAITAGPDGNLWWADQTAHILGQITPKGFPREFPSPEGGDGIATGPDGNLWLTEGDSGSITKQATSGSATSITTNITGTPYAITAGPDGNLWFTELGNNMIARVTTGGTVTEFSAGITTGFDGYGITTGPDGDLWFTQIGPGGAGEIGKITTSGAVMGEFSAGIPAGANPVGITTGPDGNLWFAQENGEIGRITTSGQVTGEFPLPSGGSAFGITAGPDGNLWFTDKSDSAVGCVTASGGITEYSLPTSGSGPTGITVGPRGSLWVTEAGADQIARITGLIPRQRYPNQFGCTRWVPPPYSPAVPGPSPNGMPLNLPLHTDGAEIVDSSGAHVKLAAVNWYGAEEQDYVPAGLDRQYLGTIAWQIRRLKFNAVRLPFSNFLVECDPLITDPQAVAFNLRFLYHPALEVLDAVINALAKQGLMVILDDHMTDPEWCCDGGGNTDYNDQWWASRENPANFKAGQAFWLGDWETMAGRYAAEPAVIGADLRNEPRADSLTKWTSPDRSENWSRAARIAGDAVLSIKPGLLVFVEGTGQGQDLHDVAMHQITLRFAGVPVPQLVYSVHDYSWFYPPSCNASYDAFAHCAFTRWGYIVQDGTAPVWVGEFGVNATRKSDVCHGWFPLLWQYLAENNLDWAYWPINGTEANPGPFDTSRKLGKPESYGVLDKSWTRANKPLITWLHPLQKDPPPTATPLCN